MALMRQSRAMSAQVPPDEVGVEGGPQIAIVGHVKQIPIRTNDALQSFTQT